MNSTNVVSIRRDDWSIGQETKTVERRAVDIEVVTNPVSAGTRTLGTKELYSEANLLESPRLAALNLLDDAIESLEATQDPSADYIETDTQLMRARSLLSQAFDQRVAIGDGYGSVISGVLWGIANAQDKSLQRKQLKMICEALRRLRKAPYLHFDSAMLLLDELEAEDIDIEAAGVDDLLIQSTG